MTIRWMPPRQSGEFAWPSVPYEGKLEGPTPIKAILAELRDVLCPKR